MGASFARVAGVCLLLPILGACTLAPPITPDKADAKVEGVVDVRFKRIDTDIFKFSVFNETKELMTLDRDGLRLRTPSGERARKPGGAESVHMVVPGGAHDLNVRFSLSDLPAGTRIAVLFQDAIRVGGRPIAVEPMEFTVMVSQRPEDSHAGGFP